MTKLRSKSDAPAQIYSISYDATTGAIKTKPHVGYILNYGGDETPHHALSSVDGTPAELASHAPQSINYNDFNKVSSIVQSSLTHALIYGTNRQRIKSTFFDAGAITLTKYYLGNYEEEHRPDDKIRTLHYISGGSGLAAFYVLEDGVESLKYTYCDYQSNLLAVTDAGGVVKEHYAYDPWGLRRNPTNWSQPDDRNSFIFSRGYTPYTSIWMPMV